MHYSKKIILILILLFFTVIQQALAFYHTKWVDVYENNRLAPKGVSSVRIDADSVNIHNDSIYYAISYSYIDKNTGYPKGYVSIIQSKGNKAGIVETYNYQKYDEIMQDHINNLHPAYAAKEAKTLKIIEGNSFIYQADLLAKKFVEVKKSKPSSMDLYNGLYGK